MLVYAGIDEAGYGPMLGPLCVGLAVVESDTWTDGEQIPNLWEVCRGVFCRKASEASTDRIPVDDSKALKLSNQTKTKDPLTYLERGVLSCLRASGHDAIRSDEELASAMGVRTSGLSWYEGEAVSLPVGTTAEHIELLGVRAGSAMRELGLRFGAARCSCADERVFNELLAQTGSKASASFCLVGRLIIHLIESYEDREGTEIRLVIDRQGARSAYAPALSSILKTADIRIIEQSERASVYECRTNSGNRLRVMFRSKAEAEHFPVALASMSAKFMRELMMRRFNRYWCGRMAELKPTAGYVTDARRWLEEIGQIGRAHV